MPVLAKVIERAFALLFGRFRRLQDLNMSRTDLIPYTTMACCVLHNVCLANDEMLEEYIEEGRRCMKKLNKAMNNHNLNRSNQCQKGKSDPEEPIDKFGGSHVKVGVILRDLISANLPLSTEL